MVDSYYCYCYGLLPIKTQHDQSSWSPYLKEFAFNLRLQLSPKDLSHKDFLFPHTGQVRAGMAALFLWVM